MRTDRIVVPPPAFCKDLRFLEITCVAGIQSVRNRHIYLFVEATAG
jgi:hypothetical protein